MELQQTDKMKRYGNYDLSVGSSSSPWYTNRKINFWLGLASIMVLLSVGLFIAGYFVGLSRGGCIISQPKNNETVVTVDDKIIWEGVCPKRETTCPEGYGGRPPLLLISMDGFRPDYLTRGLTPTLTNLLMCGSSAPYMYPVFPSKTFPNHYSIVTGLNPSSHGIIDNTMYDPLKKKQFKIGGPEFLKSYWYEGEPIWVTAHNQGKSSSLFFWVGSEAEILGVRPKDYVKYKSKYPFNERVDKVMEWLTRPKEDRSDFLTLYVNEPDHTGHAHGISSKEVNDALVKVDEMITLLIAQLQKRKLLNCVDIIFVSDHGMADVSCTKRLIVLNDYFNVRDTYTAIGAFARIRAKNASETESLISKLQCRNEHMKAYPKEQLPVRDHYSHHPRIEPIFVNIDSGWTILNQAPGKTFTCLKGNHGYDNYFPDMQALFMAYGPSFKMNHTIKPFINTELYELMCEMINITASPNNGTKGSLHDLLLNPVELPPQVEPELIEIATVPTEKMEYQTRIYVAYCNCSDEQSFVQEDVEDTTILKGKHLPFGLPEDKEGVAQVLLFNEDYVSMYDLKYRLPMWSAFTISQKVTANVMDVCWRGDARIDINSTSKCIDYEDPILQGIHQSALFPLSFANVSNLMSASLVSNSVPMHENHKILIERRFLENLVLLVKMKHTLNIVAGPAFDFDANGVRPGIDKIMQSHAQYGPLVMPTHYFYIVTWCISKDTPIVECEPSELDVVAFLLPNTPLVYNCESPDDLIKANVARVIDIERLTGITFFTGLPIYDAIRLRTKIPIEDYPW